MNRKTFVYFLGKHAVALGACFWCIICALAILVRGVRWDESFEHAQILIGQIRYPQGHPLAQYVYGAFSLQTLLSGLILRLFPGPTVLCALRNYAFLLSSVLPVYLFTTLFTRRTFWAHLAVLFMLQGVMLEFDGSYPTFVWPELYSNGHIGGAYMLLTLYLFLAGQRRSAVFAFALAPAIHIGQLPILLAVAPLYLLHQFYQGKLRIWIHTLPYLLLGIALTLGGVFLQKQIQPPVPEIGPYAVQGDPAPIWQGYTHLFDTHRQFPPGNGQLLLLGTLLLTGLAAWRYRKTAQHAVYIWTGLYVMIIALVTWGTMLLQTYMGAHIPFLCIAWMPYRVINHLPPLFLASALGILTCAPSPPRPKMVLIFPILLLLFSLVHPYIAPLLPQTLYTRYLAQNDAIPFLLFGGGFLLLLSPVAPIRHHAAFIAALLSVSLIYYHQFGGCCMLTGMLAIILLRHIPMPRSATPLQRPIAAGLLIGLTIVLLLNHQYHYRQHLSITSFQHKITQTLQKDAADALLLAPPETYMLQARTHHPILAEAVTPSLISYLPRLAPAIDRLYRDCYGITFHIDHAKENTDWRSYWKTRTQHDWEQLGKRYGFRYILAPPDLPLPLAIVLQNEEGTLYESNSTL